jgi:O-antigen/teichoic acid export membrane protein
MGCAAIILIILISEQSLSKLIFKSDYMGLLFIVGMVSIARSLTHLSLSFYRARNQAVQYAIFAFVIMAGLIIFNIIFVVYLKKGVFGVLYSNLLIYGLSAVLLGFFILKKYRPKISFSQSRKLISYGLPLILSMSGWFVMHMSSRYFLANYRGLEEVGIYGLGYRVVTILQILIVMPFQLAYGPYIFSYEHEPELKKKISRIFTYLMAVLFLSTWGMAVLSRVIIPIIAPPEYHPASSVILAILPSIIALGIYFWAASLLHLERKTKIIGFIVAGSALINLILNYLLIPRFGWPGAAIATNLSFFLSMFFNLFFGLKYRWIAFEKFRLKRLVFAFSFLIVVLSISLRMSYLLYFAVNGIAFLLILFCIYQSKFLFEEEKIYFSRTFSKIIPAIMRK